MIENSNKAIEIIRSSIALVALAQVWVSVARVADYLQSNRTTATLNQHSVPPATQVHGRACGRFRCLVVACALCGKFRLLRPSGPQAGDRVIICPTVYSSYGRPRCLDGFRCAGYQ